MSTATFQTSGVHCRSCTMMIEMTLDEVDGVTAVSTDHAAQTATVEYDAEKTNPEVIALAIRGAGYGAIALN